MWLRIEDSSLNVFVRRKTRVECKRLSSKSTTWYYLWNNQNVRQIPPEKTINKLKAFVLLSVLSLDFRPFKIPIMTAKIMERPVCEKGNGKGHVLVRSKTCLLFSHELRRCSPFLTQFHFIARKLNFGKSCTRPRNAAVQKVKEHWNS